MALTDVNLLVMSMFLFIFAFTFALGAKKHPMFFILNGIVGIIFGIEIWNLTRTEMPDASAILSTVLIGVSCLIVILGFITKPQSIREE